MSTQLCRFGVPVATPETAIFEACNRFFAGRASELFVGLQAARDVKARRWFYIATNGEWELEEFIEACPLPSLTAVVFLDNVGDAVFGDYEREGEHSRRVLGLATDSSVARMRKCDIQLSAGTLRGLHDELVVTGTPWQQLVELAHREGVVPTGRRWNAITLGIAELYPDDGDSFLTCDFGGRAYALIRNGKPIAPANVDESDLDDLSLDNLPTDWCLGVGSVDPDRMPPALMAAGKYTEALEMGLRLLSPMVLRDLPKNWGLAAYNCACALARLGNDEEAIAMLKRAIEVDPSHRADIATDADFTSLLKHPAFIELMNA